MADRPPVPRSSWASRVEAWRAAAGRRSQRRRVLLTLCGCAAIVLPVWLKPAPRLVWNASPSVPVGLYEVSPGRAVQRGDYVMAWLPGEVRSLAAARHYLPANVPLVKRVGALPPDRICALARAISVNGAIVAYRLPRDARGHALPRWSGCQTLKKGEVFLLATDRPDSFDGRYFGPVDHSNVIGPATLLWAR